MIQSWNAKTILWIKLAIFASASTASSAIYPKLACGTYLVSGELRKGPKGHYTLAIRAGSTSHRELILLGGDFDAKFERRGTRTVAKVYLPQPTEGLETPFAFLQEFVGKPAPLSVDRVKLVKKEPCGLMARYRKG